ncbi:phytase [Pseudomonas matsuisoli]|uniref:3-phytase n=1 Tax=Pseudomonas matsuisoli TaxID=1515666 RepID=A0A917UUA7_9PSED|nr:phytase [Pseudomonas matsuisoli]GGJ86405.1 3-phytase [Pseudomonas matsuisoli]
MYTFRISLLGLCIGLAACQSPTSEQAAITKLPVLQVGTSVDATEYAQLLAPGAFARGADRIQINPDKTQGLQLLDRDGRPLAGMPGAFETLDHRIDASGLLIATVDKKRQQALLVRVEGGGRFAAPLYLPKTRYAIEGLCLYRDPGQNDFLFVIGEEGIGEQWLVGQRGHPLAQALLVRALSLPPESGFCQVDDRSDSLFVNEEGVGLWRYAAGSEAPLVREPVDIRAPFGGVAEAVAGMAVVPGGLLTLDPGASALHLYQPDDGQWESVATLALKGLSEPEQISARTTAKGLDLLLVDDAGARSATLDWTPRSPAHSEPVIQIMPTVETAPVPSLGDAADDPAIWVNPKAPEKSRVLGTDKKGGLVVYDLDGKQVQDLRVGRLNNVDVRSGFQLGSGQVDLAVATNRDHNSLHAFAIDPANGELRDIGQVPTPLSEIYGFCLFKDKSGDLHAIANDKDGTFLQYRLDGRGGQVSGELVRRFKTETQPEGCVADDRNERLYIGEEDVAVWSLDARADAPTQLEKVVAVGGPIKDDIEGLALYQGAKQDYLVISSQGNDSYVVVDAKAPYTVRGRFQIGLNAALGIDGASETDGLEVTSANLGGPWSRGLLVVQDGRKRMPESNQTFKYVPWSAVADALGLE